METLSAISNLVVGVGALIISIYLLINELRMRDLSTHDMNIKAYDAVNKLGLENDENLKALAEVLYPSYVNNLDVLRQRLIAYTALNAIELTFLTERQKILNKNFSEPIVNDLLRSIMHNNQARDVINAGTYDREFTELANKISREIGDNTVPPME